MIPIHRWLAWFATVSPKAPAISDAQGALDFAGAHRLARSMAAAIAASGLALGDRILLVAANRREALLGFMAASATGTVLTPLNTRLSEAELAEIVEDAQPSLILADAAGAALIGGAGHCPRICLDGASAGWAACEAWLDRGDEAPDYDWHGDRPLFQMYTSGTTGRPSGILLSHGAWAAQIEQFHRTQPYQPGDGVLVATPLFHIAAAITATTSLLAGAHVELPPRFDAPAMLDRLGSGSVAGTMMVPAMIRLIVDEAGRRGMDRVEGVRRICYGASPIDEPLLREALGLFGCDFIQGYGLTETAGVATTLSPADHVAALAGRPELLRSAGTPVMGAQVRIAGPTGERLPLGEIGEVQIRGPNLFLGYWRNPEKTAAAWTDDGWFRTGDAGRIDCDGYLYLVDRMKDLIISGGENVFPQEVERVLMDHEAVRECAAFGIADRKWGELVAAAVVLRDGQEFDEGALRAHAEQRLARFKCPSHYLQLSELPRNATGKILRRELAMRLRPDMAA